MRRRFLLIHNPLAGQRGNRLTHKVIAQLQRHGAHITQIHEPNVEAVSAKLAAIPDYGVFDAVIAAGGDGTARLIATAISEHDIPMGLIPAGTGNVLAAEINEPRDAAHIADVLLHGSEVEIDSAHINGAPFFLMAGVGFDGEVIAGLNTTTKQRLGKLAYVMPVLRALATRPHSLNVEIDGTSHTATWLVVTRVRHYAGTFTLAKDADLQSTGLTAVLMTARTRRARLSELIALATGRLYRCKTIKRFKCQNVSVTSSHPLPAQADGDPAGTTPIHISTGQTKLRLIVPPT